MIVETTNVIQIMQSAKKLRDEDSILSMDSKDNDSLDSSFPNRLHVIQCINDIRQRIKKLSEKQSQSSTWNLQDRTQTLMPINLQLEIMDGNSVSFQSLLQTWTKESFALSYATCFSSRHESNSVQGRLNFDLPETIDGTVCSISLDLSYCLLPHRINSSATMGLVTDMHHISTLKPSSVEVVQTIPLSSVDSSLIYGVPMSARAGLENAISRYNEMKILVRQLWKYLSRNDLALVLLARHEVDQSQNEELLSQPHGYCCSGDQLFLLVCEDAVQKPPPALSHDANMEPSETLSFIPDRQKKGYAPCHGILYRYATKNQILRFGYEEPNREAEEENANSAELNDHYLDYIERSLEMLLRTGLNPLLINNFRLEE